MQRPRHRPPNDPRKPIPSSVIESCRGDDRWTIVHRKKHEGLVSNYYDVHFKLDGLDVFSVTIYMLNHRSPMCHISMSDEVAERLISIGGGRHVPFRAVFDEQQLHRTLDDLSRHREEYFKQHFVRDLVSSF